MDRKRIELLPETCKAPVLPLSLTAQFLFIVVPPEGIEPSPVDFQSTVRTSYTRAALKEFVSCFGEHPLDIKKQSSTRLDRFLIC